MKTSSCSVICLHFLAGIMFRKIVCVSYICIGVLGTSLAENERRKRIVGGTEANISDFPYQLSLQVDGVHKCGAALISSSWAVTTGYCVRNTSIDRISLRAGTSKREEGGVVSNAKDIILHPKYNALYTDFDIAAVQVWNPFPFGNNTQPVNLPQQDEDTPAGSLGVAAGWGTTQFGVPDYTVDLLQVEVPVISNEECNSRYGYLGSVNERMLCAAYDTDGYDTCQGDNGGPLVVNSKAVGLVSWAIGCGRADYPHVYTRVAYFRDWIMNTTNV